MRSDPDRRIPAAPSRVTMATKRVLDIVGAALGLLLLWPVFAVVALMIKLETPGPIFFRQERVGRGGRSFRIYKFRSMVVAPEHGGIALTVRADPRITPVGMFLRRSKLDELPQLINVLVGDMSIVGPRPEVPQFIEFYTPYQRDVMLAIRPGLTDYAAIVFHDESSLIDGDDDPIDVYRREIMPVKFAYYERYSREIGLLNDLRIVIATAMMVVSGQIPNWLGIEERLHTPITAAQKPTENRSAPAISR